MIPILIKYIEVFGVCCFDSVYRVEFIQHNNLYGKTNAGKSSFLKCLCFFFDELGDYSTLTNDDILSDSSYIEIGIEFDEIKTIRKTFNKIHSIKYKTDYSNLTANELLEYQQMNIKYFTNERTFTDKEIELQNLKLHLMNNIKDLNLDQINEFEEKSNQYLGDIASDMNIYLNAKYKWDKLIDISYEFKSQRHHFSSSERKQVLFDLLKNDINQYSILVADDFDLYWNSSTLNSNLEFINEKFFQSFICTRKALPQCTGIIDSSLQHLMPHEYIEKFRNDI